MRGKRKIMVCVTQQKSCEKLIKEGAMSITREHDELHVVHVMKENWKYFGQLKEPDALDYLFEASKAYGASLSVMKAKDIESTLANYAEDNKITTILMGESLESSSQQNMINRLQERTSKNVEFEILKNE